MIKLLSHPRRRRRLLPGAGSHCRRARHRTRAGASCRGLTFDNSIAVLALDERAAHVTIRAQRRARPTTAGRSTELHERDLTPADAQGHADPDGGRARTSIRSLRTFFRSPPSISYGTLRSSLIRTDCAFVVCACGRLARGAHAGTRDRAAPTPPRRRPRRRRARADRRRVRASSNASTPPNSLPTLPNRMQLAWPPYHLFAVDVDLRPERLRRRCFRAGPDVGQAAEAILQAAVGVADHPRVEARAGHDREALAVEAPDVEAAPAAGEPDLHRLLDVLRDSEVGREQVRGSGRDDRDGRAGAGSTSMQRCTMPSPPHTKIRSASCASALSTCLGARRLFGTSRQNTSDDAAALRVLGAAPAGRRRGSCREWAMTATRFTGGLRCRWARARRAATTASACPRGHERDSDRCETDEEAGGRVERVVHAAIHARDRDDQREHDGERPEQDASPSVRRRRDEMQQRKPDVDDDGRRDVPGRVALVTGQVVQARHGRTVAMHDQARDAVGGDLHEDRAGDERSDTPATEDRRHDHRENDESRVSQGCPRSPTRRTRRRRETRSGSWRTSRSRPRRHP